MDNCTKLKEPSKKARGRRESEQYQTTGARLTPGKAILANCYDCTCGYSDGKYDCEIEHCVFYPYMPYRRHQERVKRIMSEKRQKAFNKLLEFSSGARRTATTAKTLSANDSSYVG